MPSLDVATASLLQAAYTIGMRDGVNLTLDHLPPYAKDACAAAMIADHSAHNAHLASKPDTVEEISRLQVEIANDLEASEAAKN